MDHALFTPAAGELLAALEAERQHWHELANADDDNSYGRIIGQARLHESEAAIRIVRHRLCSIEYQAVERTRRFLTRDETTTDLIDSFIETDRVVREAEAVLERVDGEAVPA